MPIKKYLVGGAVRDQLLGLPIKDRDWVVVGATPEEMFSLGFKPVGKDFPVFLHPKTHEEYALARTERKTSSGYKGFQIYCASDITLEEDLARRDLTINAMALDFETNTLIDPYHGKEDLERGILRHVSIAFAEDPVRILRIARFSARYQFNIAQETLTLMESMVRNGEVDALVAERVWQEVAKGLMEKTPSLMFHALRQCGALIKILPQIELIFQEPYQEQTSSVVDFAAKLNLSLCERFASLIYSFERLPLSETESPLALLEELNSRTRLPSDCFDLARLILLNRKYIDHPEHLSPSKKLNILMKCDAIRRPERFRSILRVCACTNNVQLTEDNSSPYSYWQHILTLILAIDGGKIAAQTKNKTMIADKIFQTRIEAIESIQPFVGEKNEN